MTAIPAFCSHCGLVFAYYGIGLHGVDAKFINAKAQCPRCRKMADIPDGVYNAFGDVLEIVALPEIDRDKTREFHALLQAVIDKTKTVEEAESEAEKIDPKLKGILGKLTKHSSVALVIALLILQRCNFDLSADININELVDQIATNPTSVYSAAPYKN